MNNHQNRTVQEYIDEKPVWMDGTQVASVSMTSMQWRIWWLATAGKFFEGMVIFMTGVALPLIVSDFGLNPAEKGMAGAAPLFGILVGASLLGGMADYFGRKIMFIIEMLLFAVFLAGVALSPNLPVLLAFLFGMGMALGCDYPVAHLVISESIASQNRGRLVLSAFGFQAVGALAGTAIGILVLRSQESISAWRWMYASAILPAVAVLAGRFFIPQSGHWLMAKGRREDAEHAVTRLLQRQPPYPATIKLTPPGNKNSATRPGFVKLFSGKYRRATILAAVPWFLQDLSTYGIGIFTPTILAATIGAGHDGAPRNIADMIHGDLLAAKGSALIDVLLIIGILGAVLLADKVGRIRLQIIGFIGCAVGLGIAALSGQFTGITQLALIFGGFMLFNFMTNLGPNAMTYLLAGEVFPTHIRGAGSGFAASFAKIAAVLTAFLFPVLLHRFGVTAILTGLIMASLLGALVTKLFAIETKAVNLEKIW